MNLFHLSEDPLVITADRHLGKSIFSRALAHCADFNEAQYTTMHIRQQKTGIPARIKLSGSKTAEGYAIRERWMPFQ